MAIISFMLHYRKNNLITIWLILKHITLLRISLFGQNSIFLKFCMILLSYIFWGDNHMKSYYAFVYLDNESIESLYSQIFDDIAEKNQLQTNTDGVDLSANSNVLNLLGMSIAGKGENSTTETIKIVTSTYRKAQCIINYFRDNSVFSIQTIIEKNQPFDESVLFVGKGTFFLSDIVNKRNGKSILFNPDGLQENYPVIDDDSLFILESGNTRFIHEHCSDYMNTDNYYKLDIYKNAKYGIMMHMSNSKIRKDIRHLTCVIKKSKSFNFTVFGKLIYSGDRFYQIAPFAIWQ